MASSTEKTLATANRWAGIAGIVGGIALLRQYFVICAAIHGIGMGGHQCGPVYLVIRAPLQLLLIGWSYWFVARSPAS